MDNTIYFFTGTGNSLWTAKNIARHLGGTELIPMVSRKESNITTTAERVGIIFPVHMWGLPLYVIDFASRLNADPAKYYFAVAVNAGQVAATLIQLQKLLYKNNINLSAGFSLCLPSNYIPWGGAAAGEKQQELFTVSLTKIKHIAEIIRAQKITFCFPPSTKWHRREFLQWINRSGLMQNVRVAASVKKFVPLKILLYQAADPPGISIVSNALPVFSGALKRQFNTGRILQAENAIIILK